MSALPHRSLWHHQPQRPKGSRGPNNLSARAPASAMGRRDRRTRSSGPTEPGPISPV